MCIDDEAIDHIEKETGIQMDLKTLINPGQTVQPELLNVLIKPENQGCRHIKSLLKNSDFYSIRVELVQMFIRTFFKVLWDKSSLLSEKVFLESLIGNPKE